MIKWKRPSGSIIELQGTDELIKYALDNNWEQVDKPKPKKKATKKVVDNDNSVADSGRVGGEDRS